MPVPTFEIGANGLAVPTLVGVPDGKSCLSAEQASVITGETVDLLLREWTSHFGRLLTDDLPNEVADISGGVTLDPAKVAEARATLMRILRDRHFERVPLEDVPDIVAYAKQRGLNVWSGQLWAERRTKEDTGETTLFVGVCAEGLRARAHATGLYAGLDDVVLTKNEHGVLEKASATVYRWRRPNSKSRIAFTATVLLDDYYPGPGFWDGREAMMLSKCARSAALREAFPEELGSLYDRDELARTFSGGGASSRRGPRAPTTMPEELLGDMPLDRMQFVLSLLNTFGVKDEQRREEILQQLRNQFSHLANSGNPEVFYPRAWRAVLLQPKLYGLNPPGPSNAAEQA